MITKIRPIRLTQHKELKNVDPEVLGGLSKIIKYAKPTDKQVQKKFQKSVDKTMRLIDKTFSQRKKQKHRWYTMRQQRQPRQTHERKSRLNAELKKLPNTIIVKHLFPGLDSQAINNMLKKITVQTDNKHNEHENDDEQNFLHEALQEKPGKSKRRTPEEKTKDMIAQFQSLENKKILTSRETKKLESLRVQLVARQSKNIGQLYKKKSAKKDEGKIEIYESEEEKVEPITKLNKKQLEDLRHDINQIQGQIKRHESDIQQGINEPEQQQELQQLNLQFDALKSLLDKQGGGSDGMYSEHALSNVELDEILENEPGYIGCICIDEIDEMVDLVKKHNMQDFCFITNTLSTKDFEDDDDRIGHWIAVICDRSRGIFGIYDSTATNDPDIIKKIVAPFKKYFDKNDSYMHKLKLNEVVEQAANSHACGWYCVRCIHMFHQGLDWKTITGFNNIRDNEKDMKELEERYHKFGYI